ncbi:MAG: hypothetical protein IJ574_03470 [Bacilli bacterium]|nr:hypothetical protein [Bacilli bacterium]
MKKVFKVFQVGIVVFIVLIMNASKIVENKMGNTNIKKNVDLAVMAAKAEEFKEKEIEEERNKLYSAIDSFTGSLTGYVYNCPLCGGRLACKSSLDLSGGRDSYMDDTYGNVRIVASSKNLACGSIIKFNSARVSNEEVVAIVLDRGVRGNDIDLLVSDISIAYDRIGRSNITYDVLRYGW